MFNTGTVEAALIHGWMEGGSAEVEGRESPMVDTYLSISLSSSLPSTWVPGGDSTLMRSKDHVSKPSQAEVQMEAISEQEEKEEESCPEEKSFLGPFTPLF